MAKRFFIHISFPKRWIKIFIVRMVKEAIRNNEINVVGELSVSAAKTRKLSRLLKL